MKVLTVFMFILTIATSLPADTSGPKNYNECVLQHIRGQTGSAIARARRHCESSFPFEKKLLNYDRKVEIRWWSTPSTLHLTIQSNDGDYRITRFAATFSTTPCDGIPVKDRAPYSVTKEFRFEQGQNEARVHVGEDAEQFECMQPAEIYGIMKK